RGITTQIVQEAGFELLEAPSPDQAIELLSSRNDIRVVVTDVNTSRSLDGLKLSAAVRYRWTPAEIVVVSGEMSPRASELPEQGKFKARPYGADQFSVPGRDDGCLNSFMRLLTLVSRGAPLRSSRPTDATRSPCSASVTFSSAPDPK